MLASNTAQVVVPLALPNPREHRMLSWDGSEIFFRAWHPNGLQNKALILFHGGHEHSGRFQDLIKRLSLQDISIFAWDARGHGLTPGSRGYANHFHTLVKDAEAFINHISLAFDIDYQDMVVMGHSVGSVIVATWLNDYAHPVRGAVLGSPAFNINLYIPFALPGLRLLEKFKADAYINSYVQPGILTHDTQEANERRDDALISPKIAVRVLTSLFDTAKRITHSAHQVHTPILILSAGLDWVVNTNAQWRYFQNLASANKKFRELPNFYHEIFHEKNRHIPIRQAKVFIEDIFYDKRNSKLFANTIEEKSPTQHSWYHPKAVYYAGIRFLLNTMGRLSHGISLGWKQGFDSGKMLDYVYNNQAGGRLIVGRWIDRCFLNTIGWRGIRTRRLNLIDALSKVIDLLRSGESEVRVMDIASGPGRYLIDILRSHDDPNMSVLCLDNDEKGLESGRQQALEANLNNISYMSANSFDSTQLKQLSNEPNIVIASGVYELYSDNKKVKQSLNAIRKVMHDNAYLVYTNQPHHPQLELIAHTLVNREHKPWIMRLRSQWEMNQLVTECGFEVEKIYIDDEGIFSVTIAKKHQKP